MTYRKREMIESKICCLCKISYYKPNNHSQFSWEKRKFCSRKCFHIDNASTNLRGEHHPAWKGASIGYRGLHRWIRKRLLKPQLCESCKEKQPYDLANISQQYKRDVSDWEWLCRKCHMVKDGRMKAIHNPVIHIKLPKPCCICNKLYKPLRKSKCVNCYMRLRRR